MKSIPGNKKKDPKIRRMQRIIRTMSRSKTVKKKKKKKQEFSMREAENCEFRAFPVLRIREGGEIGSDVGYLKR